MTATALDTEYENGVADVLAYLAGEEAVIERNVRMPGIRSGKQRQIDVKATGALFGFGDATMIVDCKRYSKPVDVNHVGTFVALVEDVGADVGLLVTTVGITSAAQRYADNLRGIRVSIASAQSLGAWLPRGTVHFDFAVPAAEFPDAVRTVRRAGFRARPTEARTRNGDESIEFSAFRHLRTRNPSAEQQTEAREGVLAALRRVGITEPEDIGNGLMLSGGTPSHRWLEVSVDGIPTGFKVLASSEEEIASQLDYFTPLMFEGTRREQLDVIRPDVWPIPTIFPRW